MCSSRRIRAAREFAAEHGVIPSCESFGLTSQKINFCPEFEAKKTPAIGLPLSNNRVPW